MEHKCGGKIDFVSITRKHNTIVDVLLICNRCGESEESTHYLYDDTQKLEDKTCDKCGDNYLTCRCY